MLRPPIASAGGMKQFGPTLQGNSRDPLIPSGEVIPMEYAVLAQLAGPTSRPSWGKSTLTASQFACVSAIVPPPPGSALLTVQLEPPGVSRVIGELPL